MSMSSLRWSLLAVAGLGLGLPISRSADLSRVPRLEGLPDLSFAVPDSVRAMLTAVTDMVVDRDGSLYMSDIQLAGIIQLEPSGALRRVIGRAGAGPGEFHSIISLGWYRDSLWALDPGQVRLTFLPRQGRGVATVPFGIYAPSGTRGLPVARRGLPVGVLPDGSFLVQENVSGAGPDAASSHAYLLRTARSFEITDTILRLSLDHSNLQFVYRDGATSYVQPFSDDPAYALSADGAILATVDRPCAQKNGTQKFTVTIWREGYRRGFSQTIAYAPRRLPEAAVDSVTRFLAGAFRRGPRTPVTADSIRNRMYRPSFYPPVADVKVARDGRIWLKVRFADGPATGAEWLVLSAKGSVETRVKLPDSFRLLEADGSTVWGVEGDPLDVPEVVRYSLTGSLARAR